MKEQWKRLDNNAKHVVDVEEGASTPNKIEVPLLHTINPNREDYCKRLTATLRVCVLLTLLILLIRFGVFFHSKTNVQTDNYFEVPLAPEALSGRVGFHNFQDNADDLQETFESLQERTADHASSHQSSVEGSTSLPDSQKWKDQTLSRELLPPKSNPEDVIPYKSDIIDENYLSNDLSQNWKEISNKLEHIEKIVEENRRILGERLPDEKFEEVPSSEIDESAKSESQSSFFNHLLADMIVAAEEQLEKNKNQEFQNGEQMIVDAPEPRIIDVIENTSEPARNSEDLEKFEMSLLTLLMSGVVPSSNSEDFGLDQGSEDYPQTHLEGVHPVSSDDTASTPTMEERFKSDKSGEEGLFDFIASGLLSPFGTENSGLEQKFENESSNVSEELVSSHSNPTESSSKSQEELENVASEEIGLLSILTSSIFGKKHDSAEIDESEDQRTIGDSSQTSLTEDAKELRTEKSGDQENREDPSEVIPLQKNNEQILNNESEPVDGLNDESMALVNFDSVEFWNEFWEKRHLNRFIKSIAPLVGNNFELYTWYKSFKSNPIQETEDDRFRVHVAELLYSKNLQEFETDAFIVTHLISQNEGFTHFIDSEELEGIPSDTASSQIALLLFKKASLNALVRTGEVDESTASKDLEEYINMIEDIVRGENDSTDHVRDPNSSDEENNNQSPLSSSENTEESEIREDQVLTHLENVSEAEDKIKVMNEYMSPEILPRFALDSGTASDYQETVISDGINDLGGDIIHNSRRLDELERRIGSFQDAIVDDDHSFTKTNENEEKRQNELDGILSHESSDIEGENTRIESAEHSRGSDSGMQRGWETFLEILQAESDDNQKYPDVPYPYYDDYYY
ncbi:hypothetical protein QAD02_019850 [Eretmocerus hayati]|uniref:Uncharacterized protein n=1 Tax=Eretmocerus hayati TaxID=131215 RepID=A0ACC2PLX1_9HYME|nr:hypothetical protein QAD02_019850 [Eretmocerus hayati]